MSKRDELADMFSKIPGTPHVNAIARDSFVAGWDARAKNDSKVETLEKALDEMTKKFTQYHDAFLAEQAKVTVLGSALKRASRAYHFNEGHLQSAVIEWIDDAIRKAGI